MVEAEPGVPAGTAPRIVTITTGALKEDVEAGRAGRLGESIRKTRRLEPQGVFFDQVVRINPSDPRSAKTGLGRFNAEVWVLSWSGIDFTRFSKAQLGAVRFFFDALFPFVLLFPDFILHPAGTEGASRLFLRETAYSGGRRRREGK